MAADWGRATNPERKVNPSEVEGYALRNRKLEEQRGLEFRANLSVPQNPLEILSKHRVPGPTSRVSSLGGSRVEPEKLHF